MIWLMGRSRSAFWANVRMCIPVMFVSAFLNNTPVVSLMVRHHGGYAGKAIFTTLQMHLVL